MKKIVLILMLLVNVVGARAIETLVLTKADGTTLKLNLNQKIKVVYEENQIVVSSGNSSVAIGLSDLQDIGISDEVDGIADVEETKAQVRGESIELRGLSVGTRVEVYRADGTKITAVGTDASGTAIVELSQLPKGTSIIKAGKSTYKYIKK